MQKLLPKLHGSRRKLTPILITLGKFCIKENQVENIEKDIFTQDEFDYKIRSSPIIEAARDYFVRVTNMSVESSISLVGRLRLAREDRE